MDKKAGKSHFVLVHGACFGAWSWYKVATLLRSNGHRVTAIDLAASGTNPKRVDEIESMTEYMEPLMEFMESVPEDDRVVMVAHSAGGTSVSVAMEKFPMKIGVAVFVAAMMPSPDYNTVTLTHEFNRQVDSEMDNQFTFDNGNNKPPTSVVFGPKFLASNLYNLSSPEDLTLGELLVRPYHLFADETKLANETKLTNENYGSVPRVYIVIKDDCTFKENFQRWMIDINPPDEVKVINGADHMVICSKPRQLCACLLEIVMDPMSVRQGACAISSILHFEPYFFMLFTIIVIIFLCSFVYLP